MLTEATGSERCAASMTLSDLLDAYLAEREASPRYIESLRRPVRKAASYGLKTVCQLEATRANDFLRRLDLSATTRANIRRELLTLWRFAFEQAYTDAAPVRILRIQVRRKPPEAWDHQTIRLMLQLAEEDNHPISTLWPDVLWSDILPAWIGVGFDTALRFSDILMLRQANIRNGCVSLNAAKTGKATVRSLSAYSYRAVGRLLDRSPDGSVFRWCVTRRRILLKWGSFLKQHNIPGSSRWLRRSAATYVERDSPGSAPAFLSHSNPALARMHYIDPSLLATPKGPPPLRD